MLLVGRIQRYIFVQSAYGLALTLGVILMAILLVDVVEQMRTISDRAEIDLATALRLTLLKTPQLIHDTLPFAVLVGAILTFSRLSRRSEIPAMRAAGVSAWRFLGPAMALALIAGVAAMTVIDPLATRLSETFREERDRLIEGEVPLAGTDQRVWLREGDENVQTVLQARRVVGRAEALEEVTIFVFTTAEGVRGAPADFVRRIDAERAELRPGFWQLQNVVENSAEAGAERMDFLALPTTLDPDALLSRFASPDTIPFWELPSFIEDSRQAGLDVDRYALKLHTLLATPFLMVAMALIGAVVCLRLARSGGLSQLIGIGAFAGFVLFFVTRVAAGLSASGAAPPAAAAWCPPLFALFVVLHVIATAEDG